VIASPGGTIARSPIIVNMHAAHVTLIAVILSGCAASRRAEYEAPVDHGVLVRVVDAATGAPAPQAELLAFPDVEDPTHRAEALFAGNVGTVERLGRKWRCDERGETRVPVDALGDPFIARKDGLWGCRLLSETAVFVHGDPLEIPIARDESVEVTCVDDDGHPGVGAFAVVLVEEPLEGHGAAGSDADDSDHACMAWMQAIAEPDGTTRLPHAQFWRSLAERGYAVRVAGTQLWNEATSDPFQPFPTDAVAHLDFEVSRSGGVDFTPRTNGNVPHPEHCTATLRWLDAASVADDPEEIPELPVFFDVRAGIVHVRGIPLGHRFELVWDDIPGWIDPRVEFDGPAQCGESVSVELAVSQRATTLRGRLVDDSGAPFANREFDVSITRHGQPVIPDESWLVADANGRFSLEIPPGDGKVASELTVDVQPTSVQLDENGGISLSGTSFDEAAPRPRGLRKFPDSRVPGDRDLGDIRCVVPVAPSPAAGN
jgi:hypothetical protein